MVSTPGDGSCGIGTYARDLLDSFDSGDGSILEISQDDRSVRHFLSLAIRAMRSEGDVVHVQHEYGLFRRDGSHYPGLLSLVFFPVLALLNVVHSKQIVVTMHSVIKPTPDEASFKVRLYLLCLHKLIATVSDQIVFLSVDCRDDFERDVALDRTNHRVFPHGVNTDKGRDVDTATAKRHFGYDSDDDVVLIPGFIRPPKGHDIFIEVARRLPETEFLVAGGARPKGEDFDFAEEIQADAPENVTVTGVLDDDEFPVALSAGDLALLPYRVVTQSGTFNWCATQEVPVLASDESYFTRIEDEWGALETVSIDDVETVADRVATLLEDDERRTILHANIARFKRANSYENVADEHVRLYRALMNGGIDQTVESGNTTRERMLAACSAQRNSSRSPRDSDPATAD